MVCAHVRGDNPRALASGLSPVHMHNHIASACVCTLCIVRYLMQNIGLSLKGAIIKDNVLNDLCCKTLGILSLYSLPYGKYVF